ncbi:MAG: type II toxin-antitoxin system HicA family toxin [Aphanothece saxicola GSE-SYN-MK-01-06B]|nr:type II toxin-antitoxin system HicA family toxin [Aphanothece saxicola GSE-SYN-MK-01-06B]
MDIQLVRITVQMLNSPGGRMLFGVEPGTDLEGLYLTNDFLTTIGVNPHLLRFKVNGTPAGGDFMLMPEDHIQVEAQSVQPVEAIDNELVVLARMNCEDWDEFRVHAGASLEDFLFSTTFISVTTIHPAALVIKVNGLSVEMCYRLADGDRITVAGASMLKGAISGRDLIAKLRVMVGLRPEPSPGGGSHGKWKTSDGKTVVIPRRSSDIPNGTVKSILRMAGVDMGLKEFYSCRPRPLTR